MQILFYLKVIFFNIRGLIRKILIEADYTQLYFLVPMLIKKTVDNMQK